MRTWDVRVRWSWSESTPGLPGGQQATVGMRVEAPSAVVALQEIRERFGIGERQIMTLKIDDAGLKKEASDAAA